MSLKTPHSPIGMERHAPAFRFGEMKFLVS